MKKITFNKTKTRVSIPRMPFYTFISDWYYNPIYDDDMKAIRKYFVKHISSSGLFVKIKPNLSQQEKNIAEKLLLYYKGKLHKELNAVLVANDKIKTQINRKIKTKIKRVDQPAGSKSLVFAVLLPFIILFVVNIVNWRTKMERTGIEETKAAIIEINLSEPSEDDNKIKLITKTEKEEIEDYINKKFGANARIALAIAKCESGLRENAHGDKTLTPSSYGIYQIRAFKNRPPIKDLLNYKKNIDFAYELSQKGENWSHWSCYTQKDVAGKNAGNPYYYKHLSKN